MHHIEGPAQNWHGWTLTSTCASAYWGAADG